MKWLMTAFIMMLLSLYPSNAATLPTVTDILKKLELATSQTTDINASVVLTQQKTGQGIKNIEVLYYRRDRDKSFLIVMTAPESEKGNGYLRVSDNFWMYRQNTRTFQ